MYRNEETELNHWRTPLDTHPTNSLRWYTFFLLTASPKPNICRVLCNWFDLKYTEIEIISKSSHIISDFFYKFTAIRVSVKIFKITDLGLNLRDAHSHFWTTETCCFVCVYKFHNDDMNEIIQNGIADYLRGFCVKSILLDGIWNDTATLSNHFVHR